MKKASLRIDRLTAGKAEVGNEKINENASLKNEIALLNSLLDEKKKEGDRLQNGGQGKFDGISGKERDTHGNLYYYLSLLLAIFIIVITGLWLYTGIEVEKLYSETDEVNMELQQKAIPPPPVPAAISAGEDILNAMEKSPELASVISGILAEVPEDVRISSIELSEIRGGKNGKIINEINIKGFSTTEPEIADIVSTLKASRRFYDIEIASSQKTGKNIFFELKAKLR
ncbi:MAG: PilN domain-containing protein [Nitrospirae bacterium]|nr:PilN domain-containing protein [Nitrospirota bacterium]